MYQRGGETERSTERHKQSIREMERRRGLRRDIDKVSERRRGGEMERSTERHRQSIREVDRRRGLRRDLDKVSESRRVEEDYGET